MWTLILVLSSLFPAGTAAVTTVTGYKGRSVQIRCPYKSGYETHMKYLCRGECYTFRTKNIPVDSKSAKDKRFSLNDDTAARVFTVTITDLRSEDGGKYWCGTQQKVHDHYTEILLVVKVDTPMNVIVSHSTYTPPTPDPSTSVYTESTWSSGDTGQSKDVVSRSVTACAEGGVTIKCRYEDEYKTKLKSFCKNVTDQSCLDQITTNQNSTWTHKDRFSIHDNRSAGFFSVFIRELSVNDTGTYQCAVNVSDQLHTYTEVKLNVTAGSCCGKTINAYVGETVNISCRYPESHRSEPKLFCKRVDTGGCNYIGSVNKTGKKESKKNISLYYDREKQNLTVTIRYVTVQDSGEYWCGTTSNWTTDRGFKIYSIQIYLRVIESPVSASSPHSSSHISPQFTKPTTSSGASPPDTGFPYSTVISVACVSLVLLLMGTSFLIVTLRKRSRKGQESASSKCQSLQDSSHDHWVPLSDCDSEIKDTRSHFVSDTGAPTVYSTVNLPTNPSDPSLAVYAQTQLPTNPCDFTHTVSANAIILSENSSVCDTQQSARTSDEALIYTTVKFYKNANSSNDAVTKETFKKEEDTCDYASVKHVT